MIDDTRWRFIIDEDTAVLRVEDQLPLTIAHATVGRPFYEIVDFTSATISINPSAVIVSAESELTGTTFTVSVR